ncbi:uncharacterized protein LOC105020613 [Esox lucius]|uniref:uncharacterized protein LOC105020613 n=1 Tax=Esox lucius TaxID=8010 RepID=UPI0014771D29|nr:uncharacterized protein LOC105020613 [Esox lucius]
MEESFDTFEEELGIPDPPPQRPVRQVRRPGPEAIGQSLQYQLSWSAPNTEMYAQETRRTIQESAIPSQQEPPVMPGPKMMPRESIILAKTMSLQNLSQRETPWEGVTLNRCLFIAITLLVLNSGFQKLHETLKGRNAVEEEGYYEALTVRRSALRRDVQPQEPEASLYEVLFWWIPDFDDDDDEDDDDEDKKMKTIQLKKGVRERSLKGLRNRATPEKLLKGRERAKKQRTKKRDKEMNGKKKGKQAKIAADQDDEKKDEDGEKVSEDETKPKNIQNTKKLKAIKT